MIHPIPSRNPWYPYENWLVKCHPWKLAELYFTNLISSAICGWFLQFTGIANETIKPLPCSPCSYWRPPLYGPSHSFTRWRPPCCFLRPTNVNLVGGWPTPLKNMKISWDDDIPNIWKVIKFHCSKPPTSNYSYYHVIYPSESHRIQPWASPSTSPSSERCTPSCWLKSPIIN